MEFSIEQEALASAMATASRALGTRLMTNAALAGLHLSLNGNDLTLTCTDRDLTITVETTAHTVTEGEVLLPGRLAAEIVRSLDPGAVRVRQASESEVELNAGVSRFTIRSLEPSLFPRLDDGIAASQSISLPAEGFAVTLGRAVRAASTDESRAVLTGVLLAPRPGGFTFVATDSYRLAIAEMDIPGTDGILGSRMIIPARALSEMRRVLSAVSTPMAGDMPGGAVVHFTARESSAQMTYANVSIVTRVVDGRFPDYERLVPTSYVHQLTFDAADMQHALKRMKLLTQDQKTPTRLHVSPGTVTLDVAADDIGSASEDVPIIYDGDAFEIAFNPTFLSDGIDAVDSESVILKTSDSGKPSLLVSPNAHDYQYLLMPIRVV